MVLLAITICSSSSIKNDRLHHYPSIRISDSIKKYHEDIYNLIHDSIIGGKPPYRLGVYDHLADTRQHLLYIVMEDMTIKTGAETRPHYDPINRLFIDTIVLNSEFLRRGCKEYIVQLIAHESIHVFINWSRYSFLNSHINNVTDTFLQEHFGRNWQWLTDKGKAPTPVEEHRLMYQNFYDTIRNCILAYTKRGTRPALRNNIARALAWGGLEKTPEWKKQSETCLFSCIDNEAKNFNFMNGSREKFNPLPCQEDGRLDVILEQIREVLQITKSASRVPKKK
jgi:hypothetical protein